MSKIVTHIEKLIVRFSQEIEAIRESGEVAPDGVRIAEYHAGNGTEYYCYFKLVSNQAIFEGKNGKMTKTQHLGDFENPRYRRARAAIKRREAIKFLEEKVSILNKWATIDGIYFEGIERLKNSR